MNEEPLEYYFIFKNWSLDSHQWSMVVDGTALILTIFGFIIAFLLYNKQRKDKAKDAFEFFQASLPDLKISISKTKEDLKDFIHSLDLDNAVNPVLTTSLNDKFLSKINIVNLNRFYKNNRKAKLITFKNFLVDSNFFGDYHSYFSNEINYFRTAYEEKQVVFEDWQLLRSTEFFEAAETNKENLEYQKFYKNWVMQLNKDESIFELNNHGEPINIKDRKVLVENNINDLAWNIFPFIESSEKANEVSMIANRVVSSYEEIEEMKIKIKQVIKEDIKKFDKILENLNHLLE